MHVLLYKYIFAYRYIYFQNSIFPEFQMSEISVFVRNEISGNMETLKLWNFDILFIPEVQEIFGKLPNYSLMVIIASTGKEDKLFWCNVM